MWKVDVLYSSSGLQVIGFTVFLLSFLIPDIKSIRIWSLLSWTDLVLLGSTAINGENGRVATAKLHISPDDVSRFIDKTDFLNLMMSVRICSAEFSWRTSFTPCSYKEDIYRLNNVLVFCKEGMVQSIDCSSRYCDIYSQRGDHSLDID